MIRFLRALYVLLLAGFVIMFVIFGVIAFYPGPERPEPPQFERPVPVMRLEPGATPSPEVLKFEEEQRQAQQAYQQQRQVWREADQGYRRNVFFITFPLALLTVGLGLWLPPRLDVLRSGLVLGGAGLLLYGVVQYGRAAGDIARFVAVAVGLVVILYLGYRQLIQRRPTEP